MTSYQARASHQSVQKQSGLDIPREASGYVPLSWKWMHFQCPLSDFQCPVFPSQCPAFLSQCPVFSFPWTLRWYAKSGYEADCARKASFKSFIIRYFRIYLCQPFSAGKCVHIISIKRKHFADIKMILYIFYFQSGKHYSGLIRDRIHVQCRFPIFFTAPCINRRIRVIFASQRCLLIIFREMFHFYLIGYKPEKILRHFTIAKFPVRHRSVRNSKIFAELFPCHSCAFSKIF